MDDEYDDESRSPSPSFSSPLPLPLSISIARPSSTPPTDAQPSNPVTVASSSPHQILTLALPIQPPLGSSGGGGGREDCWSEGATSVLIDAWGERYLELSRGNLRQKQWQEVADVVSSRDDYSKTPKSDAQCKNRIDTLKKKYKIEKSKMGSSSWPFFNRLDLLLGPTVKPSPSHTTIPKKQRTNLSAKRKASTPSSTSDSLPPTANGKRRAVPAGKTRELTRAILRFGEVYQRVESSKLQQSMEMERQRMEFSRELEEQRMHFFMKTQIELSQLKRHFRPSSGSGGGSNNHHRHRHGQQASANRNNNGNQNFGGGLM
ncbi:trihelix transcription factor ASIL2 [Phalaenopsis equestris]|uniref:trihelix transcription factor ASIL2 n=1 Tax=Phalaenopsis equestris TaxID=78828 RepID=UPI0009E6242A|nr:trihelix transcription factor ASIL2 [Phalaenopsis equestris]